MHHKIESTLSIPSSHKFHFHLPKSISRLPLQDKMWINAVYSKIHLCMPHIGTPASPHAPDMRAKEQHECEEGSIKNYATKSQSCSFPVEHQSAFLKASLLRVHLKESIYVCHLCGELSTLNYARWTRVHTPRMHIIIQIFMTSSESKGARGGIIWSS